MRAVAFFNNKGGVCKTSLVFHLAWMLSESGASVLAADLDPQANLTSMFLNEDRLEELWPDNDHDDSVLGAVSPILKGVGDIKEVHIEGVSHDIGLIVGDLGLATFEDVLSRNWPLCNDGDEAAFRVISSFYRILLNASEQTVADYVLIDVGPNLGAINRAAIIAADYVVVPLGPDLFSLQGLRNLGPTLRRWRKEWEMRLGINPNPALPLPEANMSPIGYIVMQHAMRLDRPVKAYRRWMDRIPLEYRRSVLGDEDTDTLSIPSVLEDEHCLAQLKHYRSLMPLAMEARKPMFALKPADGAIGAHQSAVNDCFSDFKRLAGKIVRTIEKREDQSAAA